MSRRYADELGYPPRAMRVDRAAAYLDMAPATFLRLVAAGELPPGLKKNGVMSWDRLDLDAAYDNWKDDAAPRENSAHRLLREWRDK